MTREEFEKAVEAVRSAPIRPQTYVLSPEGAAALVEHWEGCGRGPCPRFDHRTEGLEEQQ